MHVRAAELAEPARDLAGSGPRERDRLRAVGLRDRRCTENERSAERRRKPQSPPHDRAAGYRTLTRHPRSCHSHGMTEGPPASLLLVHGAGSGPWVFDGWAGDFPGVHVYAVELQAGVDVASASMTDYAARVVEAARELQRPVAICGW